MIQIHADILLFKHQKIEDREYGQLLLKQHLHEELNEIVNGACTYFNNNIHQPFFSKGMIQRINAQSFRSYKVDIVIDQTLKRYAAGNKRTLNWKHWNKVSRITVNGDMDLIRDQFTLQFKDGGLPTIDEEGIQNE